MFKIKQKPQTLKVTRKLATEFSTMESAPHDRPLSENRLNIYRSLMEKGKFRPEVDWAKVYCKETQKTYRVNGKHTSTLLTTVDNLPVCYAKVSDYECDSLDDVARLYSTYDSKEQSRTSSDIYKSFAACVPELAELATNVINLTASGMGFHYWLTNYNVNHSSRERAELLLEHPEFVLWFNDLVSGDRNNTNRQTSKHIRRVPIAGAMFGTWLKSQKDATTFWAAVRDESGTTPNLPDRKLARFLIGTGVNLGNGVNSKVHRAVPREFYVKALHSWNAWRTSEPTNLQYFADAKIPSIK